MPGYRKRGVQLPARSTKYLGEAMATAKQDRWQALEAYLADVQAALSLSHWTVTIAREASDLDAWADIAVTSQASFTAELRISHDWWNQTPERQREVLCHETLHLNAHQADAVVENLEESMGKLAWAVFEPQYEDATERAVDHIAKVIAQHLPLPEFPKA